ncbi:molybdate ABC transporter substrate-binding protein [Scytonema sp. NUACC26]
MLLLVFNYRPIKAVAQEAPPEQQVTNLNAYAASSLTNALQQIEPIYEQSRQNVDVNYNFGASGTLANQILQGAPADVFFSAAESNIQDLENTNLLLPGTRRDLLSNRLAIVTPLNSILSVSSVQDLTSPDVNRVAVGDPSVVPAGQYAQELFNSSGVSDRLQPKLVFGNNVREVLNLVETGNADAGIIYITDALQSSQVNVAAIPPTNAYSPIIYPIAVLQSSSNPDVAIDYTNFLGSPQAISVFKQYGFSPATSVVPASVLGSTNSRIPVPEPSAVGGIFALSALGRLIKRRKTV